MTPIGTPTLFKRAGEAAQAALPARAVLSGCVADIRTDRRSRAYFTLVDADVRGHDIRLEVWVKDTANFDASDLTTGVFVKVGGFLDVHQQDAFGALKIVLKADTLVHVDRDRARNRGEMLAEVQRSFSRERSQSLPYFPRRIALVTSSGGQVEDDVRTTAAAFGSRVVISPFYAPVRSKAAVAAAIHAALKASPRPDALFIVRGGGNQAEFESVYGALDVLEAIAAARRHIPVVLGLGHAENRVPAAEALASLVGSSPSDATARFFRSCRRRLLVHALIAVVAIMTVTALLWEAFR